jgi:hypothetical protein
VIINARLCEADPKIPVILKRFISWAKTSLTLTPSKCSKRHKSPASRVGEASSLYRRQNRPTRLRRPSPSWNIWIKAQTDCWNVEDWKKLAAFQKLQIRFELQRSLKTAKLPGVRSNLLDKFKPMISRFSQNKFKFNKAREVINLQQISQFFLNCN